MRTEGCTVTQALTPEAASMVKQAMGLARRRGHAQVTPLHVANTMLTASTGLFRRACLQSHSHPLQCKALELCFNVALNRLPTSTAACSPMLGTTTAGHITLYPSISNALVAAFKRAQAHQRRGSVESQQQSILAVKIEIDQLVISILDDPSVSRVMREAGLSSTQVKSNVEQAVSLEVCSKTGTGKPKESRSSLASSYTTQIQTKVSKLAQVRSEDVMYVIENLVNKRRNVVIVGECVATIEGVIRAVIDKVDRRDVPEALKDVKFITLSFPSFRQLSRIEVENKLGELKALLRSCMRKGVILNLGDLSWVVEYRTRSSDSEKGHGYNWCVVEHMVMEIAKLACGLIREGGRLWLMGFSTFHTYMRCKSGHPSIESIWCLNAVTIPAGGLQLSLIPNSEFENDEAYSTKNVEGIAPRWLLLEDGDKEKLTRSYETTDARNLHSSSCSTSSLPAWLQQCKNEINTSNSINNDKESASMDEVCRKWNSICGSSPSSSERTLTYSPFSSSSSNSRFSCDLQHPYLNQSNRELITEPRHYNFLISKPPSPEPNLTMLVSRHDKVPETRISSNPNSTANSASSNDPMEIEYTPRFKELTPESLSTLCEALEKKVPWQNNIISEISKTVLKCRSGMMQRKDHKAREYEPAKEDTWLFFQGVDVEGKEKIAQEMARTVFGSEHNLVSICLSSFSSTKPDSTEDIRNKRFRDENCWSYIEKFSEFVSKDPHRVFFVEDIEQADYISQMGFKRAIERGRIRNAAGEDVSLCDAIIILSCERFSSRSRACSPAVDQKSSDGSDDQKEKNIADVTGSTCLSLDLNLSINGENLDDQSMDEIGLLDVVDGLFNFKTVCNKDDDS